MAEIHVPVKPQIQNLQQLIGDLQNRLSNLKVGSAGFKSVQNIITSMKNELDKLQIQTAKPFIDSSQFTKAEHSVDKLEDELQKVQITLSRIKFTDLELNPQQKADLKTFEDQINSIKISLKNVKDTAKQDFLGSEMGKKWIEIDPTAMTKSFAKITENVRAEVSKQEELLNKAKAAWQDYQNAQKANNQIDAFLAKGDPLSKASLGIDFNDLIQTTAKGERFRPGQRSVLTDILERELQVDQTTVEKLLDGNVATIRAKLLERIKELKTFNQETLNKNVNAESNFNVQNEKWTQLHNIMVQLGASEHTVAIAEAALRAELGDTQNALQNYKDSATNVVRSNEDVKSTSMAMASQLESLRGTLQQTNGEFIRMQRTQQSFNQMKMAVVNFMGFNQVLNLTRNAIRNAISHIKELDTVMNGISIVTDMSTSDLWNQVDAYSKMAQSYGVSIKGAYEVSQIYYQQGLQTADVLTLTNETLKLAKISGLDYATTTDYMTTAIRGFKMEMSEASTVVDVYSNLAAHTAVSQEELAVAMSKTASSMEGVGATFEEASAMIGTMVAVTRESATNIGSAMKSIASRYGELTKDPTKLVDEEGEAMAFNKVDAALQSVGISMKTVDGQFREFTDVIVELGEKWDQLDSVQQRYIATQFAGNRQQSRFLALVSNVDLLKSNLDVAMNSEDTGTLQALKALDSIEAKTEQVRVAYQQFYTTIGAENVWKGFLDGAKNVINTLNSLPKLFGKIPIGAIAAISSIISLIKSLGMDLLNTFAQTFGQGILQGALQAQSQAQEGAQSLIGIVLNTIRGKKGEFTNAGKESAEAYTQGIQQSSSKVASEQLTGQARITYNKNNNIISEYKNNSADIQGIFGYEHLAESMYAAGQISKEIWDQIAQHPNQAKEILDQYIATLEKANQKLLETGNAADQSGSKLKNFISNHKNLGQGLQSFGSALNMVAMTINTTAEGGKTWSGVLQGMAAAATLASVAVKVLDSGLKSMPWMALASGVLMAINAISTLIVTPEERLEELEKKAEELSNKAKESKAEYRTLDNSIKKINELTEKRYESAEAAEEYQTAVDDLAEKFPSMIAGFDEAGNIILDTTNAEHLLAAAREKSKQATYDAAQAEFKAAKESREESRKKVADKSVSDLKWKSDTEIEAPNMLVEFLKNYGQLSGELDAKILAQEGYESVYKEIKEIINFPYETISDALNGIKQKIDNGEEISDLENDFYKTFSNDGTDVNSLLNRYKQQQAQLNNLLATPNAENHDEILQLFSNLKETYNSLYKDYNKYFDFTDAEQSIDSLGKLLGSWTEGKLNTKGYEKQLISAWQQSNQANINAWETLSKSGMAAAVVTKQIEKNLNGQDWDYENATDEQKQRWLGYQETMADFIDSLRTDELSEFERMMNDSANYTTEDFTERFGARANDISLFLTTWFEDSLTSINNRLDEDLLKTSGQDNLNKLTGFYQELDKKRNEVRDNITTTEENYFHSVITEYDSLVDQGFTSTANTYGTAALSLFDNINSLNGDLEKAIWASIAENGLNTIEGINSIIDIVENNDSIDKASKDRIITSLSTIQSTIIPNINLSIQTETQNLLDNWSEATKHLNKAVEKKMTLQEANELIQDAERLGVKIETSDFTAVGDKLLLSTEKFNAYWQELSKASRKNSEAFQQKIDSASAYLQLLNNTNDITIIPPRDMEDIKRTFQSIGISWDNSYINSNGQLTKEAYDIIQQAIQDSQNGLNNFVWYNETAAKQIAQAWDWSQGDYIGTHDIEGRTIYTSIFKNVEELLTAINNEANNIEHYGKDTEQRAILDNVYASYDTLISDVLSKGFENIHIEDYEGLINSPDLKDAWEEAKKNSSYQNFIKAYAILAGKSVQETNDLLLQAIEKDRATQSEDLIKDFTFINSSTFRASRDSLKALADVYKIHVEEIYDKYASSFNERTQEYTITVSDLITDFGIDLTSVDYFNETVQESIDSLFADLTSQIGNAISGKISVKDVDTLKELLSAFKIDAPLDFSKTAEGLKLTEDSFFSLYSNLKKVNTLAAKQLIPSIKSMSKQYGDLMSAQKEYQDALNAGNKEKAEAIADVIGDYLRTSSEGYDLMGSDMPLEWKKAKQLYDSAYKGRETIRTASKSGRMKAEDYYSLMNTVASYNPEALIGGQTAEYWIDHAPEFFKEYKGELNVDLSAAGLKGKDFTAWIEALFEAGNKIREAGLVYEQAVDALNKGSKELSLNDFLDETGNVDSEKLNNAIKNNKTLADGLNKIIINGKPITQQITELAKDRPEMLASILKRYSEGNFTEEQLSDQIAEMLGMYGQDVEIDLDEKTGLIHLNYNVPTDMIVGNVKLEGDSLDIYNELMRQTNAQLFEGTNGFTIAFNLSGYSIHAIYKADVGYQYEVKGLGTFKSLEEVRGALAISQALKKEKDTLNENTQQSMTVEIEGVQYTIKFNTEGKIENVLDQNGKPLNEELVKKIQKNFENNQNVNIEEPVSAKGEVADLELTLNSNYTARLINNPVELTQSIGNVTGKVEKAKVEKSSTFTIEGLISLWNTIDKTHTYAEPFTAYVLQLLVEQGENFTNPTGDNLWKLIDAITTRNYPEFKAFVQSLKTVQAKQGFTNDNGESIWKLVNDNPETAYHFVALVASLSTDKIGSGFTNDEGKIIWDLVNDDKNYDFTAYINSLQYLANADALAAAKAGPTKDDLSIKETYASDTPIEYIQDVKLKYNIESDEDALDTLNTRSALFNQKFFLSHAGYLGPGKDKEFFENLGLKYSLNESKGRNEWSVINDSKIDHYLDSLQSLLQTGQALGAVDFDNLEILNSLQFDEATAKDIETLYEGAKTNKADLEESISSLQQLGSITFDSTGIVVYANAMEILSVALGTLNSIDWGAIISGLSELNTAEIGENESLIAKVKLDPDTEEFSKKIKDLLGIKRSIKIIVGIKDELTSAIKNLVDSLKSKYSINVDVNASIRTNSESKEEHTVSDAKGNVALAGGRGTLMGELGPELYVTNGHYYIAGQNGAEMVDLPEDAIVFNHLQTARLLKNGVTGRGSPVTNEYKAAGEARAKVADTLNAQTGKKVSVFDSITSRISTQANTLVNGFKNTVEQAGKLVQKVKKEQEKTSNTQQKAASAQQQAAETLAKASDNLDTSAKTIANTNDTYLHTGYHRRISETGTANNANAKRAKKYTGSPLALGNQIERVVGSASSSSGNGESDATKKANELRSAAETAISDVLSKGFEVIDLSESTYEKLDATVRSSMTSYIKQADASYREFVKNYAVAANLTVSDFNSKYFEAWQKDIYMTGDSDEVLSAAENLTFFAGGKVAGSGEDWTTIFGEYTDVEDLVAANLIEWDSQLRQYVITDIEKLKEFDTNLDSVETLVAMRNDDIIENFKTIQSHFESAMSGTLSNLDALDFKKQLELNDIDIDNLDFTETAEGLRLSTESAIKLYDVLSKVDGLQANITFTKLKEHLEKNNKNYRDIATINERILKLTQEIADINSTVDDTKKKQYEAELKVARQILETRLATEDSYYSQMNQNIEGGMNNPLNLVKDIMAINKSLSSGNISGTDFYNTLVRANNTAKTTGSPMKIGNITLDGTEDTLTQMWSWVTSTKAFSFNESGESQIDLNVLGINPDTLQENTDQFITTWTSERERAIDVLSSTIPKAAIKEALTAIDVEGFAAEDILKDNTYTETFQNAASQILEQAVSDARLTDSLKTVAIGERTLYDVLTDAAAGNTAIETAEQLSEALAQITSYEGDTADQLERQKGLWENIPVDTLKDALKEILETTTAFVAQVEKWFNYLQKIKAIEDELKYESELRSMISNAYGDKDGYAYVEGQIRSLQLLNQQYKTNQEQLPKYLEDFTNFALQARELGWNNIIHYDEETGAIQHNNTEQLMSIFNIDELTGKPNTAQALDQEAQLQALLGYDSYAKLTEYNTKGEKLVQGDKSDQEAAAERVATLFEKTNDLITQLDTKEGNINDLNIEQLKILGDQAAIFQEMRDNELALEDKILSAMESSRERAISEQEKTRNALKENFDNLINGLKDQLSRERQMYENQKSTDELGKLQAQLAILQRSGGSAAEIASLQQQIADKQSENYFAAQQLEIDKMEEAQNNELERLDAQIELMKETLAYEKEHGLLWEQVRAIMDKNPEDIYSYLQLNDEQYWSASATALTKMQESDLFLAEKWAAYRTALSSSITGTILDTANGIPKSLAALQTSYQNALTTEIAKISIPNYGTDLTNIKAAIDSVKAAFNEANKGTAGGSNSGQKEETPPPAKKTSTDTKTTTTTTTTTATTTNTSNTQAAAVEDTGYTLGWNKDSTGYWYATAKDAYKQNDWLQENGIWYYFDENGYMVTGSHKWIEKEGFYYDFNESGGLIDKSKDQGKSTSTQAKHRYKSTWTYVNAANVTKTVVGYGESESVADSYAIKKIPASALESTKVGTVQEYREGGLDDYTGLAILHGTKTDPEAIFNASQTHILRDEILSNKPTSLLSLLSSWREANIDRADVSKISNDNGVIIEKAEVIMQVQQMSNDYDAQRAGEQALDKIMQIARKSIAQNRIGR